MKESFKSNLGLLFRLTIKCHQHNFAEPAVSFSKGLRQ